MLGLVGQQRLADGALLGVVQVAAQRVQALAFVELPGDLAAVGRVGQVPISYVESRRSMDDALGGPAN